MSYKITCYCNDENISETSVYLSQDGSTTTHYYGDSSLDEYNAFTISGINSARYSEFTAVPAENYSFFRWVYRLGSPTADINYSYQNPFKYTSGQDIYIRAEGEQNTQLEWSLIPDEIGAVYANVTTERSGSITDEQTVYMYKISFDSDGTAVFSVSSTVTAEAFFGTTSEFNSTDGQPWEWTDSGGIESNGQTDFVCEVTAGTEYYIWVRKSYDTTDSGEFTVSINSPYRAYTLDYEDLGNLTVNTQTTLNIQPYTLFKRKVTFQNSGTAVFSTNENAWYFDIYGYLSISPLWQDGNDRPLIPKKTDENSGDLNISYEVTAGTEYYIWIKGNPPSLQRSVTLITEVPKSQSINKWSWETSNGEASMLETASAYTAVTNNGKNTDFSYLVWNDLVNKVKEILDTLGYEWSNTYASYADTQMTSDDKRLTASRFNSLRFNIGSHYSTGITEKSQGDKVLGNYLILISESINNWIDSFNAI